MKNKLNDAQLYGILDTGYVAVADLESVAEALLVGGVDLLQLRAKDHDEAGVLHLLQNIAPRLQTLCREHAVPLIINDFPEVAARVGADGVHIGQDDGSLAQTRAVVGDDMIVGRSTHSPEQASAALDEGFDYIGFGPLFPTPTKKGRPGIGMENIAAVEKAVGSQIPMFCIGGIKPENLPQVLTAGARRVVIVSSLLQAPNITQTTKDVLARLK